MPARSSNTTERWAGAVVRFVAAIAFVPALLLALVFVLFAMGDAASPPNPFRADPFMGGTSPDTWSEIPRLTLNAVLLAAGSAAGLTLLARTAGGRRLDLLAILVPAGVGGMLALLLIGVGHLTSRDEVVATRECAGLRFDRAAWASKDRARQQQSALDVHHCRLLRGETPDAVRGLLGKPSALYRPWDRSTGRETDARVWSYTWLEVTFDQGRVVSTSPVSEPASQMS